MVGVGVGVTLIMVIDRVGTTIDEPSNALRARFRRNERVASMITRTNSLGSNGG